MSELDFPLSELRKLEEGGESFCSCIRLDTSSLRAPMNEIVLCCLLCLTSPETVPVRVVLYSHRNCLSRCRTVEVMGNAPKISYSPYAKSNEPITHSK